MAAFDQDVLAAETMNHFRGPPGIGQRVDGEPGELLCLMDVRRDDQGEGKQQRFRASTASGFNNVCPLFEIITGIHDQVGDMLGLAAAWLPLHNCGGGQHTGLHRGHLKIIEHGIDLRRNDREREAQTPR